MKRWLLLLIPFTAVSLYILIPAYRDEERAAPEELAEDDSGVVGSDMRDAGAQSNDQAVTIEAAPERHGVKWEMGDPSLIRGRISGDAGSYYAELGELLSLVKSASEGEMPFLAQVYESGFSSESPRLRDEYLGALVDRYVKVNPTAAIGFIESIEMKRHKRLAYGVAIPVWLLRDPNSAVAWAESNGIISGTSASEAELPFWRAWIKADSESAAEKVDQLVDESTAKYAIANLMGNWSGAPGGVRLMRDWATTLGQGANRDEAIRQAAVYSGRLDPEGAKAWLESSEDKLTPAEHQEALFQCVATMLASETQADTAAQGAAPLEWLLLNENIKVEDDTIGRLIGTWSQMDTLKAISFAEGLYAADEGKYNEIAHAVARDAEVDPTVQLAWVRRMSPGPTKDSLYARVVDTWLIRDRESAEEWLESSDQ